MAEQSPPRTQLTRAQAIAMAIDLANKGRLAAAEDLSGQVIARFPGDPDAITMRAYVLHRQGRLEDAIAVLEQAVQGDAALPVFHGNLCEMHRQAKRLDEALAHGIKATRLAPDYADAHSNLGIVQFELGLHTEAEASYRRALALNPVFAEAHNNLGNLLRLREDYGASLASYQEAIRLRPAYVEALTNAGKAHLSQHEFAAAEELFRRAAALRPDYMDALTGTAAAAHGQGKSDYAMAVTSRLTAQYPARIEPFLLLAQLLLEDHKLQGALAAAEQALANDERDQRAIGLMGRLMRELGRAEDAVTWFEKALSLDPNAAEHHNQLGVSLMELGRMDEARAAFERAIALSPETLRLYTNMAAAGRTRREDPHYSRFVEAAGRIDSLSPRDRIGVHYALGKMHDDVGEHARAIDAFKAGARLKRASLDYNKSSSLFLFDRIREAFSSETIEARRAVIAGAETAAPIFIVGMPRSGSTLTEQILSSHSQVFGAGEIRTFHDAMAGVFSRDFGASIRFPEVFRFLSAGQARQIAGDYLAHVPNHEGAPRFTDKMLTNFMYVGLIHIIMPQARIIHIRRNPVDTCLSCFTRLFREDLPYTYDFDDLADYYRKYADLMAHWQAVLPPASFHEVRYEDLVNHTEATTRGLLAYLGLSWEDRCLSFYESRRAVRTASVSQVREPIYTGSLDRWKKYGAAIQPLIDRLADLEQA